MGAILNWIGCFVAVCVLCLCIPCRLFAQGFGSINGTVTDAGGAVDFDWVHYQPLGANPW